ncbi:MAG TPA: hypothetical protein VHT05_01200 [Candidatus Elarobacter sp.]|jgi:hypothetical protein|nr:hypothetical protein [Candidatus Elarobacter sp.]
MTFIVNFVQDFIWQCRQRLAMRAARPYFLERLASIPGKDGEITRGSHGEDYFFPVHVDRLEEAGLAVADLSLEVSIRFGVRLSALPVYHD